jgi:hypothetical protein
MNNVEQVMQNDIEAARRDIELAEAVQRLMANEDFNLIFEEVFFKDWLLTQGANFHLYDMDTRRRLMEQLGARSIVKTFLYDILDSGRQAKDFLAQAEKDK